MVRFGFVVALILMASPAFACPFEIGTTVFTPDGQSGKVVETFSSGADAHESATIMLEDGTTAVYSNQPGISFENDLCELRRSSSDVVGAEAGVCPDIPPFADGVNGTAEDYATSSERFSINENGILFYDYGASYNDLGEWPNPFFNARYADALFSDWHEGGCADDDLKQAFLNHARWLADTHKDRDGMAVWDYPFPNTFYDVPAGWISGIGQSNIAAVLYRAYLLTGDESLRDLSERAMLVYFRPMAEGGVVTEDEDGFWIQEIPNPNGTAHGVLNGHITAVFGIMDMVELTDDPRYQEIIDRSIDAVRSQIRKFDAGTTSYYELRGTPGEDRKLAPVLGYNAQHVGQLRRLYQIDGDPVFQEMADLFASYVKAAQEAKNPL